MNRLTLLRKLKKRTMCVIQTCEQTGFCHIRCEKTNADSTQTSSASLCSSICASFIKPCLSR